MRPTQKGQFELDLLQQGHSIVGIDEVGRGCLAGPVYAACVALDYSQLYKLEDKERGLIRDSKKLSHKQRQKIIPTIKEISLEIGIGRATAREIEKLGILKATFLAMTRSLNQLKHSYSFTILDGNAVIPDYKGKQKNIISGDQYCYSIAAASIIAKESRDAEMRLMADTYPHYGFEKNMGYGTKVHMEGLEEFGICTEHRRNFAPVAKIAQINPTI